MKTRINAQRHAPVGFLACVCNDKFLSSEDFLRHLRVFGPAKLFAPPVWTKTIGGALAASINDAHRLYFIRSTSLNPITNLVTCSCGWQSRRLERHPRDIGWVHLETVLQEYVYGRSSGVPITACIVALPWRASCLVCGRRGAHVHSAVREEAFKQKEAIEMEEFACEVCGEECDDLSFSPLCPDCHWDEEGTEASSD